MVNYKLLWEMIFDNIIIDFTPSWWFSYTNHSLYVCYISLWPPIRHYSQFIFTIERQFQLFFRQSFLCQILEAQWPPATWPCEYENELHFLFVFFYVSCFFQSGDCPSKPLNVTIVNVISCLIWSDVVEDFKNVKTKYKN